MDKKTGQTSGAINRGCLNKGAQAEGPEMIAYGDEHTREMTLKEILNASRLHPTHRAIRELDGLLCAVERYKELRQENERLRKDAERWRSRHEWLNDILMDAIGNWGGPQREYFNQAIQKIKDEAMKDG